MKRTLLILSLVAMITPSLLSADDHACDLSTMLAELRKSSDEVIYDPTAPADPNLIFMRFDEVLQPGRDTIRVEYLLRGETYLVENIRLLAADPASSAGTVIELLAADPGHLARLHELAPLEVGLEVRALLRGELIAHLPFAELVQSSAALREEMQLPQPIVSEITYSRLHLAAGATVEKPTFEAEPNLDKSIDPCVEQCEMQYLICEEFNCQNPPCPTPCDDAFEDCLEYQCGICQEEITYSTKVTFVSRTLYYPIECVETFWDNPFDDTNWYQWTQYIHKRTKTKKTKHTDCSVTTEVVEITYIYSYCWTWVGFGPCTPYYFTTNLC